MTRDVAGSVWAMLVLNGREPAPFMLFPPLPCGSTNVGIESFGLTGEAWLREFFRGMGPACDESLWYREVVSDFLEILLRRGTDVFEPVVWRISHGTPLSP